MTNHCETCRWWRDAGTVSDDVGVGYCLRQPVWRQKDLAWGRPIITRGLDTCGEWQQAEPDEQAQEGGAA